MAYSPSDHAVVSKALGPSGDSPTDGRQMYYDKTVTPNKYRPFVSTAELIAYCTSAAQRQPGVLYVVNDGGTLAAGVVTGGVNSLYHWKNNKTDSGLVAFQNDARFNVVDYGANPNNSSDDSAAIKAALAACFAAGGGVIYFPLPRNSNGYHYYVDSSLITSQDSINPNAQIVIPLHTNDGQTPTIMFVGEVPPSGSTEGIAAIDRNNVGVIIESRIQGTGTRPAVFGTSYYTSGGWGDRNFVNVGMKDLVVRTSTMSGATDIAGTMTAVNFEKLVTFQPEGLVKVDISSALVGSVSPASANTAGIVFPNVNNKAELSACRLFVEGYTHGLIPGEHFNAQHVIAAGCTNGITVNDGYHSMSIQQYTAEVCNNSINLAGTGSLNIFNYETEHYTGAEWFAFATDIKKTSGSSFVRIFNSNVVLSGVGRTTDNDDFVTSGSPDYKILFGCGENALSGGGGGTAGTLPEYSDADLLALGGSTPFTYYNTDAGEMQYFDGTDYFSLDKTPYTPTAATTVLFDDFNRANSSSAVGNTVTPGSAWPSPLVGTWGISSNRAYCVSESSSGSTTFYVQPFDVGVSDFTIECVIRRDALEADGGIFFRCQDATNSLFFEVSAEACKIYTLVSGTFTSIGSALLTNDTSVDMTVKIVCAGNSITAYKNGTSIISITESTFNTQTKIAMYAVGGVGFGGGVFFDDLEVTE